MREFYPIIKQSRLFEGIEDCELDTLLECLSAKIQEYKKGEYIFRIGEHVPCVGIVLEGSVHIIKEDYWGNRSIIGEMNAGKIFGEAYACSQKSEIGVSVVAAKECKIIFLNVSKLLDACSSGQFHVRLIQNLVTVLAEKNIMLTGKIEHMSRRKLRDKILSYLSEQSRIHNSPSFKIPFNRQELADYLSVDRSALSNELCKLRDEGVLNFNKNHFTLT